MLQLLLAVKAFAVKCLLAIHIRVRLTMRTRLDIQASTVVPPVQMTNAATRSAMRNHFRVRQILLRNRRFLPFLVARHPRLVRHLRVVTSFVARTRVRLIIRTRVDMR